MEEIDPALVKIWVAYTYKKINYKEAVLLIEERKIEYESALERVSNFKNDIGVSVFGESGNVWEDGIIELICEYL